MLIITGTGRSGTGMFAKMLGGFHEFRVPYLLHKYFKEKNPCADPFGTLEKRLDAVLDLHQGIDTEAFIDSSNLYIHFLDAVHYLNPTARFVLVTRNGKDFVRSGITRKWHETAAFGTAPLPGDPHYAIWHKMSPLQKNAWIWVYRNGIALDKLKIIPESLKMVLRLEDARRDSVLDKIEQFAGKPLDRSWAHRRYNANPDYAFPPAEEWSDLMNEEFDCIARDMMTRLGYS